MRCLFFDLRIMLEGSAEGGSAKANCTKNNTGKRGDDEYDNETD